MTGRETLLWGRPSAPEDAPRRSVLHCIRMLAPFREALPELGFSTSDLAEGERQFYAFVKALYGEMYGDPAFFLIPEGEYDDYMGTAGERKKTAERRHETDQKECRLRNRFQQAIRFYTAYLYELGIRAESLENGVLTLSEASWREARKAVEWPHLRGGNEPRYQRLHALGLDERCEPGGVYITSREYPKMMYGLWALCAAPDNKYRYMDYLRLDYRAALRGGPEAAEIYATLSPERAAAVRTLHEAMAGLGMRVKIKPLREITSGSRWKVEYQEHGKCAAGFYAGPDSLTFCLYFGSAGRVTEISARLWEEKPALGAWLDSKFPERLCKCPSNRRVELGDGPRRICGLSCRAEIEEPTPGEIENYLSIFTLLRENASAPQDGEEP